MNALTPPPPPPQVPKWFAVAGFACIALFILFLMWLIISDHRILQENRMLVVFLLAITLAAGLAFIGGNAAAKGILPIPYLRNAPIQFTIVGGVAAFIIALLVGYYTYAAGPAVATVNCAGLISKDGGPAQVTFKNYSNRMVDVYWVNYMGAQQKKFNLGPRGEQVEDTYINHSWCVLDASNGQALQAITISSDPQDVLIQ